MQDIYIYMYIYIYDINSSSLLTLKPDLLSRDVTGIEDAAPHSQDPITVFKTKTEGALNK